MAIAFIASATAGSTDTNVATTVAINTTGASLIVIASASSGALTPTDSAGNTWVTTLGSSANGSQVSKLYYVSAPTTSGTHTFTVTGAGVFPSLAVLVFSGSKTSADPFDQQNGATANATSIQPGSVTPGEDNEVLVTGTLMNIADVPTINSGFATVVTTNFSGGNHYGVAMSYLIQGALAAVNPTWSFGSSETTAARIATFKVAAAGGTSWGGLLSTGANRLVQGV